MSEKGDRVFETFQRQIESAATAGNLTKLMAIQASLTLSVLQSLLFIAEHMEVEQSPPLEELQ